MRAKISVRLSKFVLTLFRNMRRRRKTRSIPSPFPVIILFGLIVLLRYLNVSSFSDNLREYSQQAITDNSTSHEGQKPVHGDVKEMSVSEEKRKSFLERRHAERRAMHRRIVEQQREKDEKEHTELKENSGNGVHDSSIGESKSDTASHSDRSKNYVKKDGETSKEGNTEMAHEEKSVVKDEMTVERVSNNTETKSGMTTESHEHGSRKRQESKTGVPAGARLHGKQPEFGGSLGGSKDGMVRGQNITRVSYTLFKIMKLFGFVSLVDSMSGDHTEWMPEVVERMSFDQPSFQYTAVDTMEGIEKTRKSMGDVVDGEYLVSNVEERTANGSDVVFHWTELDGGLRDARSKGYVEHVRRVMVAAKKGDNGYIIFGQFPRLNGPQPTYRKGKWVFVGENEDPFLYNDHVRGVVPIGNGRQSYMLYMTFYSLRSIPMAELQV